MALVCASGAIAAMAFPATAPAVSCSFNNISKVLTVDLAGGEGSIRVNGANIEVRDGGLPPGGSAVACTNGPAALNNTDQIAATDGAGNVTLNVSLDDGLFQPGFTAEGAGTSEIEILPDLGAGTNDRVVIRGRDPEADHFRLGANPPSAGVNLNAPEGGGLGADGDDIFLLNGGGVEFVTVTGDSPFSGTGGADVITANGGAPEFTNPFPTFVTLRGLEGSDTLASSDSGSELEGDNGPDILTGGAGNDFIEPGLGDDTATGGGGSADMVDYFFSANGGVTVDLAASGPQNTGGSGTDTLSGFENLQGTNANDVLLGTNGPNTLVGGFVPFNELSGDDLFIGRGGNDLLQGYTGNDTASYADGSTGPVTVDLGVLVAQPTGGAGTDTLPDLSDGVVDMNATGPDGVSDIENVVGSPFVDTLTGNNVANAFNVRDGGPDTVTCLDPPPPPPADSVVADRQGVDTINADCEQVDFLPTPEQPPPVDDADGSPPDTRIDKGPKRKTKKRQATFQFSSTEAGSTFQCSVDDGPFSLCSSPFTTKVKKGKHEFEVRATDAAGNVDPTAAAQGWKVKKKRR